MLLIVGTPIKTQYRVGSIYYIAWQKPERNIIYSEVKVATVLTFIVLYNALQIRWLHGSSATRVKCFTSQCNVFSLTLHLGILHQEKSEISSSLIGLKFYGWYCSQMYLGNCFAVTLCIRYPWGKCWYYYVHMWVNYCVISTEWKSFWLAPCHAWLVLTLSVR